MLLEYHDIQYVLLYFILLTQLTKKKAEIITFQQIQYLQNFQLRKGRKM